jgi:hypothetical protein
MTNREDLEVVLEGKRPARIPLAVYEMFVNGDPCWWELFAGGLCLIGEASTVKETLRNVELVRTSETWCGKPAERLILRTPVGEISQLSAGGLGGSAGQLEAIVAGGFGGPGRRAGRRSLTANGLPPCQRHNIGGKLCYAIERSTAVSLSWEEQRWR